MQMQNVQWPIGLNVSHIYICEVPSGRCVLSPSYPSFYNLLITGGSEWIDGSFSYDRTCILQKILFYCFHFYSLQIYLIFWNKCNASSSSSCNDRPVTNTWSSRSLFLLVLSDDFLLFIGRHLQTKASYNNSNCTHNFTDHKCHTELDLSTVKLFDICTIS